VHEETQPAADRKITIRQVTIRVVAAVLAVALIRAAPYAGPQRALTAEEKSAVAPKTVEVIKPDDVKDFVNALTADDAWKRNFSELAQRTTQSRAQWQPPPAAQPADAAIIAKLNQAVFETPSTGTLSVAIDGLPVFHYIDGEQAPVDALLLNPDGETVSRSIRDSQALFEGIPLDRRAVTLSFSIKEQGSCWFCSYAELSGPVSVRFGDGDASKSVAVEFKAKDPAADFLQKVTLPGKYKIVVRKTVQDPDAASGDDRDPDHPQVISATRGAPFGETPDDSIAISKGDATDHLVVGGRARFTMAVVIASGDLRNVLVANRRDNGQAIGVYSADGNVFAVAAADWTPINLRLQAKNTAGDMSYKVYSGSSNDPPGAPFLIWLAGLDSITSGQNGVPLAGDALLRRLAFVQHALGVTLGAENLDFIQDPEAKENALHLRDALAKVSQP